ncbi:MAG: lipid A biosynthesis protein [Shimia sp.]|nr:lipid A biosynthesis protein [Shimia sp.]
MDGLLSFLKVNNWIEFWWVAFGLFGQLMFTGRFVVQWIASERAKRSTVPLAFWYFSIAGALILFAYAVYRQDPVFILGQSFGIVVYSRNLWLIHKEKQENGTA